MIGFVKRRICSLSRQDSPRTGTSASGSQRNRISRRHVTAAHVSRHARSVPARSQRSVGLLRNSARRGCQRPSFRHRCRRKRERESLRHVPGRSWERTALRTFHVDRFFVNPWRVQLWKYDQSVRRGDRAVEGRWQRAARFDFSGDFRCRFDCRPYGWNAYPCHGGNTEWRGAFVHYRAGNCEALGRWLKPRVPRRIPHTRSSAH